MKNAKLTLNKRAYTLQHPGARAYYQKKKELYRASAAGYLEVDYEKMFDYAFAGIGGDQIVFAEDGKRIAWEKAGLADAGLTDEGYVPTLDEMEDWEAILPMFLRGQLHEDYQWGNPTAGISEREKGKERATHKSH